MLNRIVVLFLMAASIPCCAQYYMSLGAGLSVYNGDLGHHNTLYGGEESNHSLSVGVGFKINNSLRVNAQYMSTKLEGSDAKSENFQTRNLSFFTNISELSILSEIHVIPLLGLHSKWVSPFVELGGGVFHFNPKSKWNGTLYELQKLRTEGQGLPGSNLQPYELIDYSFQAGLGIEFNVAPNFKVSIASRVRLLSTDYLDDVSGRYYDLSLLARYKGPAAVNLAYRGNQSWEDVPPSITQSFRGNPKNNDSYLVHECRFTYIFDLKRASLAK